MIAFIILPIYILINVYIIRWLFKWTKACSEFLGHKWIRIVISVIYSLIAFSGLLAFFIPKSNFERFCKLTFNYWLGILAYTVITVVIADIIRFIYRKIKKYKKVKPHRNLLLFVAVQYALQLLFLSAFTVQ